MAGLLISDISGLGSFLGKVLDVEADSEFHVLNEGTEIWSYGELIGTISYDTAGNIMIVPE